MSAQVYPIRIGMVTIYLIKGKSGSVLVDTGYPKDSSAIIEEIHKLRIKLTDIKLIIITHGHTDHFGSAESLQKVTGAKVAIHRLDADNVKNGVNGVLTGTGPLGMLLGKCLKRKNDKPIRGVEPDVLLDDEYDLSPFGIEGKVISTPGHTPGGVSIMLKSGIAIVGDLVMSIFNGNKPAYPIFTDDFAQLKQSINKVISYQPTVVYSGHGGPFTVDKMNTLHDGFFRGFI